jgi:hypothetical protein
VQQQQYPCKYKQRLSHLHDLSAIRVGGEWTSFATQDVKKLWFFEE